MLNEQFISASQLSDLVAVLAFLMLLAAVAGVLVLEAVRGLGSMLAHYLDKRRKPPSAATLQLIARNLRKRAAVLEIRAEKKLQAQGAD